MNAEELKNKAADRKKENQTLFRNIKRKKPSDLDKTMQELHNSVFEKINCLDCAKTEVGIIHPEIKADIVEILSGMHAARILVANHGVPYLCTHHHRAGVRQRGINTLALQVIGDHCLEVVDDLVERLVACNCSHSHTPI